MPPKKWTETLAEIEKIFENRGDTEEGVLYSKTMPSYTTLLLQTPITAPEKFRVMASLYRNLPREGLEMLIRLRDILGFVSSQKLAQETATLLKLVACDLKAAGGHERVLTALTLYNRSYVDEAFAAFLKISGESDVPFEYRVECCRYLFSTNDDRNVEFAQECLLEIIGHPGFSTFSHSETPAPTRESTETVLSSVSSTDENGVINGLTAVEKIVVTEKSPSSSVRYDIISTFISSRGVRTLFNWKKIPVIYDETFVYGLQAAFFAEVRNGVRERILSGAHILSMSESNVDVEEKNRVVEVLLGLTRDSTLDPNIRGDAADAVLHGGDRKQRVEARRLLGELGFSGVDRNSKFITSRTKTVYNNEQNVHDESIAESVTRFIEVMVASDDIGKMNYETVSDEIVKLLDSPEGLKGPNRKADKIKALGALKRVERDTATFSSYSVTIAEILVHVWLRIISYSSEPEVEATLKQRLIEELLEMGETCSSGHCARFINVLSAVDPQISISFESQIQANLAGRINAKIRNIADPELADQINTGMMAESEPEDREAYLRFVANAIAEIEIELRKEFVGDSYISDAEFTEFFGRAREEWA